MNVSPRLIKALAVTREVIGAEVISDGAMKFILHDLASYPEEQVIEALRRCTREVKGKTLSLQDIISRIDDGRPQPEEAWASIPKDEAGSVVWTAEMREAWSAALPLIADGQLVPARMAFLEKYRVAVQKSRDARLPVIWEFSPGTDKSLREVVLLDAAEKGRISVDAVARLLPYHREQEGLHARLLAIAGKPDLKVLTEKRAPPAGWTSLGQKLGALPKSKEAA